MRIFTGNYDDCKVGNLISISGDKGRSVGFVGKTISELAPKRDFWNVWHSNIGKISEEENNLFYIREYYKEVLSKIDVMKLLGNEIDPILLCYEKGQAFCHRHVLAEFIEIKYDIRVLDIKINDDLSLIINPQPIYIKQMLQEVMS